MANVTTTISNISDSLTTIPPSPHQVWGWGLLLVTGVNMCSLFGVAVNPLSKKHWYKNLLLFMVSVAVGVLAGSSLLFLLSGALGLDDREWPEQKDYIIKVTIALTTVFLFFNFEQFLKLILARVMAKRKLRAAKIPDTPCPCRQLSNLESGCDTTNVNNNNINTDETTKSLVIVPNATVVNRREPVCRSCSCSENNADVLVTSQRSREKEISLKELPVSTLSHHHPNTRVSAVAGISLGLSGAVTGGDDVFEQDAPPKSPRTKKNSESRSVGYNGSVQIMDPVKERDDSESISSIAVRTLSQVQPVAWMIIFGDGIHNFVDGLSIGAGMAQSFNKGLSIVLAVMAEELPHELGDLAVLLRAGLSLRQALIFNFLSACLCYVGFAIGAIIGELPAANQVIFAMAAGLFLYIALTDLLPEVSPDSTPEGHDEYDHRANTESLLNKTQSTMPVGAKTPSVRHLFTHLVIADAGMIIGYLTIVILAIYSSEIDTIMDNYPHLLATPILDNSNDTISN